MKLLIYSQTSLMQPLNSGEWVISFYILHARTKVNPCKKGALGRKPTAIVLLTKCILRSVNHAVLHSHHSYLKFTSICKVRNWFNAWARFLAETSVKVNRDLWKEQVIWGPATISSVVSGIRQSAGQVFTSGRSGWGQERCSVHQRQPGALTLQLRQRHWICVHVCWAVCRDSRLGRVGLMSCCGDDHQSAPLLNFNQLPSMIYISIRRDVNYVTFITTCILLYRSG